MNRKRHWTESMFVDNPELFLPFLEDRLKTAKEEVRAIKKIFDSNSVRKGARVLDLCCGIGRHSVELARFGYNVVGIDLAPEHIKRANDLAKKRNVAKRTEFIIGDMRDVRGLVRNYGRFDVIINMFTSFGYYDESTDLELFNDLSKLIKKRGVLIIETINRDWIVRNFQSTIIDSVKNLEVHQFNKFDFETSHLDNVWRFYRKKGDARKHLATIELNHRIYSVHELVKMLHKSEWGVVNAYDGLALEPLNLQTLSNRLVVVARRQ